MDRPGASQANDTGDPGDPGGAGGAGGAGGTVSGGLSGSRYPKWHWVGADPDDDSEEGRFRRRLAALARDVMLAHGADEDALPPVERTRRAGSSDPGSGHDRPGRGSPSRASLDVDDTTAVAIEEVSRAVRGALGGVPGTMGSTTADRLLLAIARSRAGATTGALARTVGVPASTVSTVVSGLADDGLVERRPLPSDRRRRLAVATASGEARAERVAARWRHVDERLLSGLSVYERDELARLLRRAAAVFAG